MEGRRPRNSLISGAEGIHEGANRLSRSGKHPAINTRAERPALNAGRRQGRRLSVLASAGGGPALGAVHAVA